jgi:hypothetical protein
MKPSRGLLIGLVVAAIAVLLYLLAWRAPRRGIVVEPQNSDSSQASTGQHTPVSEATSRARKTGEKEMGDSRAASLVAAYSTPIAFYGRVVDETGNPVSGAKIKFGTADNPLGDGSYHYQISDQAGRFELRGAQGLGVAVWVSKEGYYTMEGARGRNFVYGGSPGVHDPVNPTFENPAIFVLKKIGEAALLMHVPRKSIKVLKDGTPVEIDLSTGRTVVGKGHLRVEVWTANQDINGLGRYAWRARVSVPGGGLIERLGEYAFEAPEAGYTPAFEASMEANAQPWRDGFQKEFFVKLETGQFARVYLRLLTGGDHFIVLESYLHPLPGSRNLEFDPEKQFSGVR